MSNFDLKEILSDVRNYLDITWKDAAGDKKLTGIIKNGAAFVQRLTQRPLLFEEGTAERSLLFDYCRYARSGAVNEFSKNYLTEINTFSQDEAVKEAMQKGDTE